VDLFDVVRSCFRRWWVLLPLLLVVGWFSYDAYTSVKPVYYSNTVIGLSPPNTKVVNAAQGVPLPRNGLLEVGGAALIANMTTVGLMEPAVVDRVVAAGGLPDYVARMFPGPANMPQLPLVMVEATNADPAAVSRTLELVVAQSEVTMRNLQEKARVPEDQMVAPFVVSSPSTPAAGMPSRTRSTISIFAAGFGLSVVVTVLVDVLLCRRRRRIDAGPHAKPATKGPILDRTPSDVPERDGAVGVNEGVMGAR
jgi:hypothetical protein